MKKDMNTRHPKNTINRLAQSVSGNNLLQILDTFSSGFQINKLAIKGISQVFSFFERMENFSRIIY